MFWIGRNDFKLHWMQHMVCILYIILLCFLSYHPSFAIVKVEIGLLLNGNTGLYYLHNGCKPSIVHRDLKPSNILLNEDMQAMIVDFGLSKAFINDIDTHVTTRPAGTVGYLDPE